MLLIPLKNEAGVGGKLSGTGIINLKRKILGGVLISTDSTNAAVVQIRKDNSSGDIIFDESTKNPMFPVVPIQAADQIYYNISGTGASAQLFEWMP